MDNCSFHRVIFIALMIAASVLRAHDTAPAPGGDATCLGANPGCPIGWFAQETDPSVHEVHIAADSAGYHELALPEFTSPHEPDELSTEFFTAFPPEEISALPDPHDPALHGRIGFRFSPHAMASSSVILRRPGLGGFANRDGSTRMSADFSLSGVLSAGRLAFAVNFAPHWEQQGYRFVTDPADTARDEVFLEGADRRFTLAETRSDRYAAGLRWTPAPRHVFKLAFWGSPQRSNGRHRLDAFRLNAADDAGISILPARNGITGQPAGDGEQSLWRTDDRTWRLSYAGELSGSWRLEAEMAYSQRAEEETPAPGADRVNFNDIRRTNVYEWQKFFGVPTVVTPAQYRFGGLGIFEAGTADRELNYRASITHGFSLRGTHTSRFQIELHEARFRENQLRSGPRGENGPLVALRQFFGRPDPSSVIRLRSGFTAEMACPYIDPAGVDLQSACPSPVYFINQADLSPLMRDDSLQDLRLSLFHEWKTGRLRVNAGIRYDRVSIASPNRFTLHSDADGSILTGSDGFPVGSRVEDIYINPTAARVTPPFTEAPGLFVAGSYRFPAAFSARIGADWDPAGNGSAKLYGAASRVADDVPADLAQHAFENKFGIAYAGFYYPDLTNQNGSAVTYGGGTALIAPGTRQGYTDHLLIGFQWDAAPSLRVHIQGEITRLGRVLVQTQANYAESIANRLYDFYLVNDAQFGSGYCLNCTRGQTTLFPGYTPGYLSVNVLDPNPDARSFLSETLANPGENTLPGRFQRPERHTAELALAVDWRPKVGGPLSVNVLGRMHRARGNYSGMFESKNGVSHPELTSQYMYPDSPLTHSMYTPGPLDDGTPSSLQLVMACDRLGISGLSAALRGRWTEGLLRNPRLSPPLKQVQGVMPGDAPLYYVFDPNANGVPHILVLKDYHAVARGAWGRYPGYETLDAVLRYVRPLHHGTLTLSLEARNLLNDRHLLAYDDDVEIPLGYVAPATGGVSRAPNHEEPPTDPTLRGANPAFGLPTAVQSPRVFEMGVSWSF